MWIGIAVAMITALLVAVMLLDAQYMEAAATASRRRYEMVRQARTRGHGDPPHHARLAADAAAPRRRRTDRVATTYHGRASIRGLLTLLVMIGIGAGIFVFSQRETGNTMRRPSA